MGDADGQLRACARELTFMTPFVEPAVALAFETYPTDIRQKLVALRDATSLEAKQRQGRARNELTQYP